MNSAVFFGVLSLLAGVGMTVEYRWSRRNELGWHEPRDTLANLNLAAGNVVLGTVVVAGILAAYTAVHAVRPLDLHDALPGWAVWVVGFLLAEFLQYWNHRLSHAWNPLAWGHLTHHSSPHLNLSTAVRINWFYRAYAWVFYLPLPLLGFTATEFVVLQTLMNGYNLFQHTRLEVPFGPLEYVLVSPRLHRLHHGADASQAGNYGASLIVFDRLFGTCVDGPREPARYGLPESVTATDPLELNFHWLVDLHRFARRHGRSPLALWLGFESPVVGRHAHTASGAVTARIWAGAFGLIAAAVCLNAAAAHLPTAALWVAIAILMAAIVGFGRGLTRPGSSHTDGHVEGPPGASRGCPPHTSHTPRTHPTSGG